MDTVLIVSRTKMKEGVCVGAIIETTGESIRLHDERGANLAKDAEYQIGQEWEMDVQKPWNSRPEPHLEDRQIRSPKYVNTVDMAMLVSSIKKSKCNIIHGGVQKLFDGALVSGCGSSKQQPMYINEKNVPNHSVAFWIADKDLVMKVSTFNGQKKVYYVYDNTFKISYVGFQSALTIIPQGTMIRMSLASWWKPDDASEKRCYLQLSGWYL
ncbi:MAG: hypothetical protein ACFNVK_11815 [Prevotella sp.]